MQLLVHQAELCLYITAVEANQLLEICKKKGEFVDQGLKLAHVLLAVSMVLLLLLDTLEQVVNI